MIKRLDWDSNFFGFEIGELIYENKLDFDNSYDLLYLKNDQDFDVNVKDFTKKFSETKLIFSKDINDVNPQSSVFSINEIQYDINEIYELAYESGKFSRFFLDGNFEKDKFKELYQKWVDNSISNIFADDLLVYLENNQIQGFVTYKVNNKTATIGLIAVHPNHQGKGVGGKLLRVVENKLFENKINKLLIPTQQKNVMACDFYKKYGYQVYETTFIKHYWRIKN